MSIEIPFNINKMLTKEELEEKLEGNRYESRENLKIVEWMIKGLEPDGKGRSGVKSGCSITNIQNDLNNMYDKTDYKETSNNGEPLNRRSKNDLYKQVTRLSLPNDVIGLFTYYEANPPINYPKKYTYNDILKIKDILLEYNISSLTIGGYKYSPIDSPIIIEDNLTQPDKDILKDIKEKYPFIKLNIKTMQQYINQQGKGRKPKV